MHTKENRRIYRKLAFEVYKKPKTCEKCGTNEKICVHHIDKNPGNNKENNLMILCNSCHIRLHMIGNKHSLGNKNCLGKKLSQEHKIKIGLKIKGRKHTNESKLKISNSLKGKTKGKFLSQETRNKISNSLKGKNTGKIYKNSKQILQYDLNGNFIKTWQNLTSIYHVLGYPISNIIKNCNGIYKTNKGFIWKFKNEKK